MISCILNAKIGDEAVLLFQIAEDTLSLFPSERRREEYNYYEGIFPIITFRTYNYKNENKILFPVVGTNDRKYRFSTAADYGLTHLSYPYMLGLHPNNIKTIKIIKKKK